MGRYFFYFYDMTHASAKPLEKQGLSTDVAPQFAYGYINPRG
jgi:hypothetical protein